jgi:hypothetical protein
MRNHTRIALLILASGLTTLLAGCPGMPGGPSSQQNTPPGLLPPPGLESGGARTLMGTTITAPDNSIILFKPVSREAGAESGWQSCRRIMFLDNSVLVEGVNYDGREAEGQKDFNEIIPLTSIERLQWQYVARPAPPAEEKSGTGTEEKKSDEGK